MEILGAMVVFAAGPAAFNNLPHYFSTLLPAVGALLLVVFVLGVLSANIENLYGSFLTLVTGLFQNTSSVPAVYLRAAFTAAVATLGTLFAVLASSNLLTALGNFLLVILYLIVPWTAINLTDYYIVRRGRYAVDELYRKDGIYGRVNWPVVAIYVGTIIIEVPFMNLSFFTGPVAARLDGADITWVVGLGISFVAFLMLSKLRPSNSLGAGEIRSGAEPAGAGAGPAGE